MTDHSDLSIRGAATHVLGLLTEHGGISRGEHLQPSDPDEIARLEWVTQASAPDFDVLLLEAVRRMTEAGWTRVEETGELLDDGLPGYVVILTQRGHAWAEAGASPPVTFG